MSKVQSRKSHRGKRHRQNSSSGGFSEHEVASDLVVHSQDLSIISTQGSHFRPGQVFSRVDISSKLSIKDIDHWVSWE